MGEAPNIFDGLIIRKIHYKLVLHQKNCDYLLYLLAKLFILKKIKEVITPLTWKNKPDENNIGGHGPKIPLYAPLHSAIPSEPAQPSSAQPGFTLKISTL